ncbi:hypothetical protein, partial [Mesorhizobium sp.]|uniref:hypothetical protein n=1 Tax=Mesorhizobium sp. TaxID=1871066 RepID=UPI0025F436FE
FAGASQGLSKIALAQSSGQHPLAHGDGLADRHLPLALSRAWIEWCGAEGAKKNRDRLLSEGVMLPVWAWC